MGSLLYLSTHTRPDTLFSVNLLRHLLETKLQLPWGTTKRLLKYLVSRKGNEILVKNMVRSEQRMSRTDLALSALRDSDLKTEAQSR